MTDFLDTIRRALENNGYETIKQVGNDLFMRPFPGDDKPIWICYLDQEITSEQIRRCFDFPGYLLFVVNEKLIPDAIVSRQDTPMWLRVLHGLYMGRIYTWNGRFLFGLHFDYDTGDVSESSAIDPSDLLLIETGTWLRGWPGTYRLARFWDKAWWVNGFDDVYERERQKQNGGTKQERAYYAPPKPQPREDFNRQFAQAGSPSAVKALYRALAKQYHPDLNPGVDTTIAMQQINAAYERWK